MSRSELMSCACQNLTTSMVTIKLMGIKLLYKIKNVRMLRPKSDKDEVVASMYDSCATFLLVMITLPTALASDMARRMLNKKMIWILVIFSTDVRFIGVADAFLISLDSCPVKMTTP